MEVIQEKRCENCGNFRPYDPQKGICSVPIWADGNLYKMRYVKPEEKICYMFEEQTRTA